MSTLIVIIGVVGVVGFLTGYGAIALWKDFTK